MVRLGPAPSQVTKNGVNVSEPGAARSGQRHHLGAQPGGAATAQAPVRKYATSKQKGSTAAPPAEPCTGAERFAAAQGVSIAHRSSKLQLTRRMALASSVSTSRNTPMPRA